MAIYATYLGKRVHVRYRAGETQLPVAGILVGDSGRSIFLEEQFEKSSGVKNFRWEIPYQCIVMVEESSFPQNP
jgi:hypothetical protein